MSIKITKKMYEQDKMYGTTVMGARGQVVIPAEARKDLNLNPGDKLIVMGKLNKALGLVKAEDMQELITEMLNEVGVNNLTDDLKKHIENILKQAKNNK